MFEYKDNENGKPSAETTVHFDLTINSVLSRCYANNPEKPVAMKIVANKQNINRDS